MKRIVLMVVLLADVPLFGFYNPAIGRWTTRDPKQEGGGTNLYAFCENGSTCKIDPLGENIYLYTGNDSSSPLNNLLHQCIAVDTWSGSCPPAKTGRVAYSFAWTGSFFWSWPNGKWLGNDSFTLPGYWMEGSIYKTDPVGVVVRVKKTNPKQDREWKNKMDLRIGERGVYSVGRHNCRAFSQKEFEKAPGKE